MKLRWLVFLVLLLTGVQARADNHALLIGIDEYQDRNNINPLSAAAKDAKDLAKTLIDVADFPAANVHLLTSDGENKPTGANIVFELGQLVKSVKAGDTVFITFSGHGVESEADEVTYLLPYDADARSEATLTRTGVSTAELFKQIKRLPARAVVFALDMCRSDPKKGARDVTASNRMGKRQAENFRTLVVQAAQGDTSPGAAGDRPRLLLTLFACSPGQRSWEWGAKQRGYFSYFLEQGLRAGAADSTGVVRLPNLISYIEKAVPGAVQRELGQDQTPAKFEVGTGAQDVILAKSRPAGSGGETAVPVQIGSSAKERYDAAFQRGMELYKQGRFDAAQLKFEDASEIDPKAAMPVARLADIAYWFRKDVAATEALWKKAIDLDNTSGRMLGGYANFLFGQQNLAKSIEVYEKALALSPNEPLLHSGIALAYQFSDKLADAERHFRKSSEIDPKDSQSISGLGYLRALQGDLPEAERILKRASALDPKSIIPFVYLGEAYSRANKIAEAERTYEQAIALEPKNGGLHIGLGLILIRKGDTKGAVARIRQAVEIDPRDGRFRANLAHALLRNGQRDEAVKEANKALELGFRREHPAFDALGIKP